MSSVRVDRVVTLVKSLLAKDVWERAFILRISKNKIEKKLTDLINSKEDFVSPSDVSEVARTVVYVEIYQKDLGIITLSKVLASLGDRAFGRNIFKSLDQAKFSASTSQRFQKNIALIEVEVMADKVINCKEGYDIRLAPGSILISNVKGAWFREVYYKFDASRKMFMRS